METTQETVAAAVNSVASARGRGTLPNMMAFARALKQLGVKVSLSQVIDAARSADLVDVAEKQDFRALLRSNLILQKEDFPVFDMVFDSFWREQSYERLPMETLEIQGTPSESGAEEGGDEEGLEEAVAEAAAQENMPLENLDEFSIPTYSPQELLNRKDFSEMGVEESRAIARAILLIATKIATQIRDHRVGAAQTAHQKNQGGASVRCQRLDGLLQPFFDPVHVRAAKRALGRGDVCFQHLAQPHHPFDPHQGHRQRNFRHHSRLVRRHEYRPLAAHLQPQLRA
ncbi:MAG: VWA domain containing CoxE-like protein [Deltaproteobacteria bacterium]|nr:VWA domain containing CoxE-like protein [Deltaproteobacteria bacterium]